MKAGQILFFAIIALLVLSVIATIIDSWRQGRKEGKRIYNPDVKEVQGEDNRL